MKKIFSILICIAMLASLAIMANAEALNLADGLQTDVTIKKANSAAVVKDGVIGAGEYAEVEVNRDRDTTDLLMSWNDGINQTTLLDKCLEFLQDVHFYFSWDEVNGLNMAIRAKLLETPYCETPQPADDAMTDDKGAPIPGDEFCFQFGAIFKIVEKADKKDEIVIYRGLGYNTVEGKTLTGHYGRHGYTGSYNLVEGQNYAVKVEGNWVTYEISYPLASVLKANNINGNAPVDGSSIMFDVSATGGSTGTTVHDSMCYAVSLGDHGYMQSKWAGTNLQHAKGYFSNEEIPYNAAPAPVGSSAVVTTEPITEIVTSYVPVTTVDEEGNVVEVTNADGSVVTDVVSEVVTVAPTTTTPGQGTQSPTTGDPMIIAAVVAAISACGIVVAKKRK